MGSKDRDHWPFGRGPDRPKVPVSREIGPWLPRRRRWMVDTHTVLIG